MAVCLALCAPAAYAANPDDLDYALQLTRNPPIFHAGEPIEFLLTYSSRVAGKYRGQWTDQTLGRVTIHLTPPGGAEKLLFYDEGGFAPSMLVAMGNLDPSSPVTHQADLAVWYRFEKAGHYEVRATSRAISRIESAAHGGGLEPVALETNSVGFEVLPRDPAWEAQELAAALRDFDAGPPAHADAIHRLAMLDTPDAVRKLVSLYLDGDPNDASWIYPGFRDSAHPETIIPLLETALEDPRRTPDWTLVGQLAELQARQKFGPAPTAQQVQDFIAEANAKLVASLPLRSGAQRNVVQFQAWKLAEENPRFWNEAPPMLVELRQEVLASAKELPLDDVLTFVGRACSAKWLPKEQLLPLLRYLAPLNSQAYPLWCEEAPRECNDAILAAAAKPDSTVGANTILLLKESEHAELDEPLKARLAAVTLEDTVEARAAGALVLRAGSRNLRPAVKAALAQFAGKQGPDCEIQAYLVNYSFRFAPKDAAQYLGPALADKKSSCAWLAFLARQRYSDDLIPIARQALDSPNPNTAASGALFLGVHGPADFEDTLWRHLDAFREHWRDRAGVLRSALPGRPGPGEDAYLEQALVNALLHGANWKLTPAEQERLRAGCLMDDCRQVAVGEFSLYGF